MAEAMMSLSCERDLVSCEDNTKSVFPGGNLCGPVKRTKATRNMLRKMDSINNASRKPVG